MTQLSNICVSLDCQQMDILSDVSVSGKLSANRLSADRLDVNNTYTNVIELTNTNGGDQAIIVCGDRVIDFNSGGVNINECGGGVRICGSSLSFKSKNGYYPVFIGLTEFNDSTMHIRADASGFCFNGHMNISGDLCVTDGSIFASRISLTNKHLVSTMTKSLTVPANCSKFHIITAADDFVNPLPYLATMSNGDNKYHKNVNVDYLFNMCNLIGIVTPSGESRSMTFTILQRM